MRNASIALFCLLPVFVQAAVARTPQEEKLLEEISRAIEVYEQESKAFKREVQLLIEQKYKERRSALGESYEKAIRDLEIQERKERLDAVAQFAQFLRRYPYHRTYTPDVMFRLAARYPQPPAPEQV